jgi:biopolymer transport protein ExbD
MYSGIIMTYMKKYTLFAVFMFLAFTFNVFTGFGHVPSAHATVNVQDEIDAQSVSKFNSLYKPTFKIGMKKGADVKAIQQFLKDEQYYSGKVDGKYGKITARAIKDFAEDNDITLPTNNLVVVPKNVCERAAPPTGYHYAFKNGQGPTDNDCGVLVGDVSVDGSPVISGVNGPQSLFVNQQGTWSVKAIAGIYGNSYSVVWGDEVSKLYSSSTIDGGMNDQSATFIHRYSQPGLYKPVFTVTNHDGKTTQTSITVSVGSAISTDGPKITVISAPQSATVNQEVTFSFSATNPNNSNLNWSINSAGSSACGQNGGIRSGNTYTACSSWSTAGSYLVTVYVTDNSNSWSDKTSFTVNVGSVGVLKNNYDVNGDGQVTVADFQKELNAVMGNDTQCGLTCDLNNDDAVNVADLQKMINYLQQQGSGAPTLITIYDVNSDGSVNVVDFQKLYNAVMGIDSSCGVKCDLNGDISVNVADLQKMINYLLGVTTTSTASPLSITTPSPLPNAKVGQAYTGVALTVSGASDPSLGYVWSSNTGDEVAPGLGFYAAAGTRYITGTPTAAGSYTFTLKVVSGGKNASKQFVLTIDPASIPTLPPTPTSPLSVISPNGGETYKVGDTVSIKWRASGQTSANNNVGISIRDAVALPYKFILNQYSSQSVVNGQVSENGAYSWTIPANTPAGKYIVYMNTSTGWDESDSSFSIIQ